MGVLEQVIELRNKGISDKEIISSLREQGISPKEVNDALGQATIKGAVSQDSQNPDEEMEPSMLRAEKAEQLPTEGSLSDEDLTPPPRGLPPIMQQQKYVPLHRDVSDEEQVYSPQAQQEEYYPPYPGQELPQQYQQQNQDEYQPGLGAAVDTDTIIEIAEQVIADKMRGPVKQIEAFNEFKTLSQTRIDNISERLKRIESTMDTLQIAILEKVGAYGRGLDSIKKEMEMMQDSFGKVVGTVLDKNSQKNKPKKFSESEYEEDGENFNSSPVVQRIEKRTTVLHKSQKQEKDTKPRKKYIQ